MEPDSSTIQQGYDRWAAVYDSDGNPLQCLEGPRVRAALADVAGLQVLDLGCGTGRHTLWLADQGANVTAIDFSDGMLALARTKAAARAIRFLPHDLHLPLPFPADSFDRIVCGLVLEHLKELRPIFAEVQRVLRPAGRAVVSNLHPAMFLRGAQARFTDPHSGEVVHVGSWPHSLSDLVMPAIHAGLVLVNMEEHTADAPLVAQTSRAEKYLGWPMLVVLTLAKPAAKSPLNQTTI